MSELCTQYHSVTEELSSESDFLSLFARGATSSNAYSVTLFNDLSRRDVRVLIFHLLYACQAHNYEESLQSIVLTFNSGYGLKIPLDSQLFFVTQEIINSRDLLEKIYVPFLNNWRLDRVSVCTKLILLFGVWELNQTDTDPRIVINEAIELAKCFAEDDAYRFINGILDAVAKKIYEK